MKSFFLWACFLLAAMPAPSWSSVVFPEGIPDPPADKAQIVFIKPAGSLWAGIPVGLLRIDGDRRELLGILTENDRITVTVEPGRHRFMSHQYSVTHFLDAEVVAGKRYVVLLRFLYGNGFQLRPIRQGAEGEFSTANPDFPGWLQEVDEEAKPHRKARWYARKDDKLARHQALGQNIWDRKTDDERAQLTLRPEDAF